MSWLRIGLAGLVVAAGMTRAAIGQAAGPIVVTGRGVLEKLSLTDGESLGLDLRIKNTSNTPIRVTRAEPLLACEGGWSTSMEEMIGRDGKFFGNEAVIGPGNYAYKFQYVHSTPVSHYLLALQLERPGQPAFDQLIQVPFVRAGFPSPKPLPISAPAFVALQEPVEVFKLATGATWLPIIGQIVNVSGKPMTVKRWRFRVEDAAGKALIDDDLLKTYDLKANKKSINEFLYGYKVPDDFSKGTLEIDAELDLDGRRVPITRQAEISRVEPRTVRSPVRGAWVWSNGPGELEFHSHYHFPEQRYAYDLGVVRAVGGRRGTFTGDPHRNESYFCWNQPVYCAEDGKVIAVIDDVPDNNGDRENPANNPQRNSGVMVEHPGRLISGYYHLRQGSAAVKVGQTVKAGDLIGRVGNAGASSEPHLHFDYLAIDRTGRYRNVPLRIEGLTFPNGRPADGGVPKGSLEYLANPEK